MSEIKKQVAFQVTQCIIDMMLPIFEEWEKLDKEEYLRGWELRFIWRIHYLKTYAHNR